MNTILRELLDENEKYKQDLEDYAAKLHAELDSLNKLMDAVEHSENEVEALEQRWCLQVTGAFKPVGVIDINETLREDSPFYADAKRRERYISFTTPPTPFGESERQCLQKAIIKENKRKAALHAQQFGGSAFEAAAADDNTFLENTEGIDWAAVARDVSAWSHVKRTRTAHECKVRWLGAQHPKINTQAWSINENKRLSDLVEEGRASGQDLNWEGIAAGLETNRTVLDCIRQYQTKVRSNKFIWTKEIDTKLLAAVEKYGTHNWVAVASAVSSELSPNQCQIRYDRTLDPNLRRGKFTTWEDQELLNALEIYGTDWIRVAQKLPGRSNAQCRAHYKSIMEASKARWSEPDDESLMEAIKRHGINWTNVEEELGSSRTVQDCRERYQILTMSASKPTDVNSGLKPTEAMLQPTPDSPQNQEQQHIVDEAEPTSRKKSEARPSSSISQKATSPDSGAKDHSSSTNITPTRKRKVDGFSNGAPSTETDKDATGPSAPHKKRKPRQVVRKKQTQETTIIEQTNETHVASGTTDNNKRMTRSSQHGMTRRSGVKGNEGSITNQPPK